MSRFQQLKAKLFKERGSTRTKINNKSRINTIVERINNKKLREDTELKEREYKLMAESESLKKRKKNASTKMRNIRLAPIKNAFATAKKLTGGAQKALGKAGKSKTNPLMGSTGSQSPLTQMSGSNPFYPEQKEKKMRKRRVRIIDYE